MLLSTTVAIIGGGPSGLACREQLRKFGIDNIVIDNNSHVGGQFNMQTHQFFFFEQVQRYGGMRGFDIAKALAGDDIDGIMLNATWDILDGRRLALKNVVTGDVSYLDAQYLVVATGAVRSCLFSRTTMCLESILLLCFREDDESGTHCLASVYLPLVRAISAI